MLQRLSLSETAKLSIGKGMLNLFQSLSTEAASFLFALKWILATGIENSFVQSAHCGLQKSGTATETT